MEMHLNGENVTRFRIKCETSNHLGTRVVQEDRIAEGEASVDMCTIGFSIHTVIAGASDMGDLFRAVVLAHALSCAMHFGEQDECPFGPEQVASRAAWLALQDALMVFLGACDR